MKSERFFLDDCAAQCFTAGLKTDIAVLGHTLHAAVAKTKTADPLTSHFVVEKFNPHPSFKVRGCHGRVCEVLMFLFWAADRARQHATLHFEMLCAFVVSLTSE